MLSHKVNDLAFADDIALLEGNTEQQQKQVTALKIQARQVGLEININKTGQMRLNIQKDATPAPALKIDDQEVAIVNDFKYLGAYVGSTNKDVNVRIGLAWVAFHKLKSILKAPKTKINFKIRLFKAACISILLYGCETWILTKHLANRLDAYATNCYRIMLGIDQKNDHNHK